MSSLATKAEWNGESRLTRDRHPTPKIPSSESGTVLDVLESRDISEQMGVKSNHHVTNGGERGWGGEGGGGGKKE